MRLIKYLGKHKGAVALVFVLLICQAFCDLMLPNYTADIVDVGIQQAGVEHASTDELTSATHDFIAATLGKSGENTSSGNSAGDGLGNGEDNGLGNRQSGGSAAQLFADSYAYDEASGTYKLTPYGASHRQELDTVLVAPLVQAHGLAQESADQALASQIGIAAAAAEYNSLGYDMGAMQLNYLLMTALKMMGFVLLSALIATAVGFVASRTGAKIGRGLRNQMFAKVMSFSDAEVQRFSAASLITRATNDIQLIQMMSILLMRMVLYAPILAIGGVIMILRMNISMGWIVGVAVIALIVVTITLMMIAIPKFKIMQKLIDRVNLVSREMLTGVQVVRAFGQQAREQQRFDEASTNLMRTQMFTGRVMTFMMPTMTMIMNVVSVVIVWVGAGQIDAGAIQTGDLIAFITYSMLIIMGFLMLSMLFMFAPRADVAAQRIDEVLEAEVSIADAVQSAEKEMGFAGVETSAGAEIEFDHVFFRYDDASEYVLQDVTFTAEAGKTCAIIGPTGSGKSTMLKLIERFYDVSDGVLRVDGMDVRDYSLKKLRSQFGYVPQRAFLFTGTIESNVGYGTEGVDDAHILEAIDIAQANELVDASEDGLQAEITQGGTNVSGGQRQRLAIARALATNARAFLFDDSFSALDYKTDAALRRALAERLPGKTQVIVAQRIATVMQADKIIVLDEGCVVGQGKHADLLRTCEQYREIAYSQLSPKELAGSLGESEDEPGDGHATHQGDRPATHSQAWATHPDALEGGEPR